MIGLIDYGAGNLNSVQRAFETLGFKNRLIANGKQVDDSLDKLVVPGVGAFGYAAGELKRRGLWPAIKKWLKENRPFLAICLGLQLLFEGSEESPAEPGLGFFRGKCHKLASVKVPHTGWNEVEVSQRDYLFEGIKDREYFYFVHSYAVFAKSDNDRVLALTSYGETFISAIKQGNIYGVQFHPEKSGPAGLKLLSNWSLKC